MCIRDSRNRGTSAPPGRRRTPCASVFPSRSGCPRGRFAAARASAGRPRSFVLLLTQSNEVSAKFGGAERHAAHLVVALGIDEVLRAQQAAQLAEVHFGHDDAVVRLEHFAEVGWERIEMAQVLSLIHI